MKLSITADRESSHGTEEPTEAEDAAQDVLDAIEAKDAKALSLALERHYACCADMGEVDEDEEEM